MSNTANKKRPKTIICQECGISTPNSHRGRQKKYCGPVCKEEAAKKQRTKQKKECVICGALFETVSHTQKCCSQGCRGKYQTIKTTQKAAMEIAGGTKTCRHCGQKKTLEAFGRSSKNAVGYDGYCRWCKSAMRQAAVYRGWKRGPKTDKDKKRDKAYKARLEVQARRRKKEGLQRKNDPSFRLNTAMRQGIWRAIKNKKEGRHWEDLVGYGLSELMVRLESRFTDGMTWDNYGEWHVDHIIPKDAFNFNSPKHPDFKRCWALDNLQPLWAEDNVRKSNKLEEDFQPMLRVA